MKPITFRPARLTRRTSATDTTDAAGKRERRKARVGLAAVVAGCVALTSVVVLSGPGSANSGMKFTQSGHWVYNSSIGRIFHLDGATKAVDAEVGLSTGQPGAQVIQSDKNGYVLSRNRIDQFGKSDLTVTNPIEVPLNEQPTGLEGGGAAFAVYQKAGRVIRFGDRDVTEFPGGPLGDPVVTSDGTLWIHRISRGDLCQLPITADRLSCSAAVPKRHKGALTAIGAKAVFVDLTSQEVYSLTGDGISNKTELPDVAVADNALVAGNDVDGKLAIVDPGQGVVQLVDPTGADTKPTRTLIKPGKYDKVASSGDGLALLDRKNAELATLDRDGKVGYQKIASQDEKDQIKREPNLFRGDDSRVYVESSKGDRVVVVDQDGRAKTVEVGSGEPGDGKTTTKPTQTPPTHRPSTPPPMKPPVQPPVTTETQRPPARTTPPPTRETKKPDKRTPEKPKTSTPTNQPTAKPGLPGAPGSVLAKQGGTVTWKAAAPHGATITSYRLSWSGGSTTVAGTARSATIQELASKSGYYVTVQAVNRVGAGPAVRSNRVELDWDPAESPRELLVSDDGISGRLTLAWDQPTMGEGTFLRYDVSMGGRTRSSTSTQLTWTGLTDGRMYEFTVRAITKAPDGSTITGKEAILSAASVDHEERTKRVVASRGAGTEYNKCEPPVCAFLQVRIENLTPNTDYVIKPYSSGWGNFNPGATLKTNSEGHLLVDDRFPCSALGQLVWATVETTDGKTVYTSNKFRWKSG
ncbi:fibronectin type III domain protein [Kribbella antiqua]|uniref:Fibronectin type III domain protein n=1 Tax=Kribbella antiqua TaxID=2512217 RepID=A0A4R2IIT0_9ACTN|nr:fibronectin type III domain-containing protein [Kribbella antiqua]TCO43719.1 fibronectin type III domain protein [Kribbella antiqua]